MFTGEENCSTATIKVEYKGQLTIGSSSNCKLELTDIPQYSLLILELASNLEKCKGPTCESSDYISLEEEDEDEEEIISKQGETLTSYFKSSRDAAVIQFYSVLNRNYSVTLDYTGKCIAVIVYLVAYIHVSLSITAKCINRKNCQKFDKPILKILVSTRFNIECISFS